MATLYPDELDPDGQNLNPKSVDTSNTISLTKTGANTRKKSSGVILYVSVTGGAASSVDLTITTKSDADYIYSRLGAFQDVQTIQPGDTRAVMLTEANAPEVITDDDTIDFNLSSTTDVDVWLIRLPSSLVAAAN